MSYNLEEIEVKAEGTIMPILHPVTNEPLKDEAGNAATLTLAGADSEIYRKASNKVSNRRIRASRGQKLMNAERLDSDALEIICACTLAWDNVSLKGETPKTADELYRGRKWLQDQADQWIHDRANYLGN
jgi:hypothetical protein